MDTPVQIPISMMIRLMFNVHFSMTLILTVFLEFHFVYFHSFVVIVCLSYDAAVIREIEACAHLLASLCSCLEQLLIIRENSEYGSLFPTGDHKAIDLFNTSAAVNQYCFYGRCIGFHVSVAMIFIISKKCFRN